MATLKLPHDNILFSFRFVNEHIMSGSGHSTPMYILWESLCQPKRWWTRQYIGADSLQPPTPSWQGTLLALRLSMQLLFSCVARATYSNFQYVDVQLCCIISKPGSPKLFMLSLRDAHWQQGLVGSHRFKANNYYAANGLVRNVH